MKVAKVPKSKTSKKPPKSQKTPKRKKWLWRLLYCFIIFWLLIGGLELFYRNQWIDTYRRELKALNPEPEVNNPNRKILVMGDSFSAAENSWVNSLRKSHPDYKITNSSVPGTTIFQANLMLKGRLETFKPDLLVYQVYAGNDLFDLRYPLNWSEIGFGRNLYWMVANGLPSISWLNYALGQMKRSADVPDLVGIKDNLGEFDPKKYSPRELLYLSAEPDLILNQSQLLMRRGDDMDRYLEFFEEFMRTAEQLEVPMIVVVLPHCAQVNAKYAHRMAQIGALGMENENLHEVEYPFWRKLRALQNRHALFVNLLPVFQETERDGSDLYYLHDIHLNNSGQADLADVIDQAITKLDSLAH